MKWLGDAAVERLQATMHLPDLNGTRYRAIRFLASGGMAAVWLAEDTILERKVALKILDAEEHRSDLAERLLREAHILATLEHPGIVPVHDAGVLPDGNVFYCMKYVEGQRLDEYLTNILSPADRLRLFLRIAEPIAFAHSRGIIHRDLKPENVMVGSFGEVLVMDWGLGKILGNQERALSGKMADAAASSSRSPSTGHGTILGTPGYMAPEQLSGDTAAIDQRADIYGLGAILKFLLGRDVIEGDVKRVFRPLESICSKATQPDAVQRYPSVKELTSDVASYLQDSPVSAYAEPSWERLARLFNRHKTAVILVAAYLLMRLLFILLARR